MKCLQQNLKAINSREGEKNRNDSEKRFVHSHSICSTTHISFSRTDYAIYCQNMVPDIRLIVFNCLSNEVMISSEFSNNKKNSIN